MKKPRVFLVLTIIVTGYLLFRAGMIAGAASNAKPGSSGDPLITQSYLEERLAELDGGGGTFKKVTIKKGAILTASSGAELIMYSGSGTVSGSKGLINLSSGQLFKSGNVIALYSLYFFPDASSGVKASSDCVVYIKGTYVIQ